MSDVKNPQQSAYGLAILAGLADKHVYGGFGSYAEQQRHRSARRAKNRVARRSRAINRKR